MKKLLLVYPNQSWQKQDFATNWVLNPATLCQLASMVKDEVDVKITDANFYKLTKEEFSDIINDYKPDYVGISVLTSEYGKTLDITAQLIKKINKNIIVIAGGVHAIIEYENIIENSDIDYVVRGEGEIVLRDLIKFLKGRAPLPEEGLVYKEGNRTIIQNHAIINDLDSLPWPDYSLVNFNEYINNVPRKGPLSAPKFPYYRITVTRGCPFGCSFCQVETIAGKKIRSRSAESVIDHLVYMKQNYGIKSLVIDDDNMLGKRDFFNEFLKLMISKKIDLPFIMGGVSVFLLNDELIDLMARAHCFCVNIAIESGNERVSKQIIKKPLDLKKVPEIIKKIKGRGIYCLGNFMIGLPGEKWDEILDTINYIETSGVDYAKIFIAIPLKKTRLWEMAAKFGSFVRDISNIEVDTRFGQLKGEDWSPKDVSILRAYEWDRINFGSVEKRKKMAEIWHLSEEELKKIRKDTRDAITLF